MDSCKGKLYGMVVLIFVCGVAVGGIGTHFVEQHWRSEAGQIEAQLAMEHFRQELELNEEQARQVEAILDEFIMSQAELMSQFQTSRLSGHDRIVQILNDDQRRRFQEVWSELNTRRKD